MTSNGGQASGGSSSHALLSRTGRIVVYESHATDLVPGDDNTAGDCFLYDRQTKKTRRISLRSNGNQTLLGSSDDPDVSDDGRFVAFESSSSDMVPNDTNTFQDVFVSGPLR